MAYGTYIFLLTHIIKFLMKLHAPWFIQFWYINTFLDSLLEGLQEFPTLKQTISLEIGLKCIISDYNKGHIIRELCTRGHTGAYLSYNASMHQGCLYFKVGEKGARQWNASGSTSWYFYIVFSNCEFKNLLYFVWFHPKI